MRFGISSGAVCLGILILPALSGAGAPDLRPEVAGARESMDAIERFLSTRMTDPATGAVYVNAVTDRPVVAGEARNRDVLSETVGQLMELALLRNDRRSFERQLALIKTRFLGSPPGFIAWKISLDPLRRADTSATLDDWRVAWACRMAAKRWDVPEAGRFGFDLARELARGSAGHFVPPPAFNLGDGSAGSGPVLLCYLHLPAMREFGGEIPECRTLYENSRDVLGRIPPPAGMVPAKWDPDTRSYSGGASDEVLALITLLHMQSVDAGSARLRDAIELRARYFKQRGMLPQAFDSSTGEALAVPAGASVYALWARLLLGCGRIDEAGAAIQKMREFQNGPASGFPGAIGGYPVFSFDQLEALLALEAYLGALNARGPAPNGTTAPEF